MIRAAGTALAAVLLLAPPPAAADPLEQIPAARETPYRGRKMVLDLTRGAPQITRLTVLFQAGGRERREFHESHALLVVVDGVSWHYMPRQQVVVKRQARGGRGEILRPEQLRRARSSYRIRAVPAVTVAGRASHALEFAPLAPGSRPLRRVWIDAETGLILRAEVYGTDNRLAWLSAFETLEYGPEPDPGAFTMRIPAGVRVVEDDDEGGCLEPEEAGRITGLPVALPEYLPEGFDRQCVRARRRGDYGEIQVLFGDGLSLLSLFGSTRFRPPAEGAGVAEGRVGSWPAGWYDLGLVKAIAWRPPWAYMTLLGELSREELERVAASVRLAGELPGDNGGPSRR